MAATRLSFLRSSNFGVPSTSSGNEKPWTSTTAISRCLYEPKQDRDKTLISSASKKKKQILLVMKKASVEASERSSTIVTSEPRRSRSGEDLASLLANVTVTALLVLKVVTKPRLWKLNAQVLIERVIIDCRFFALLAVAGSLVGSILCFVEGSFFILESYFHYFQALSHHSDQGDVVHLLIEAIDMFLLGTAMLTFGMGLHVTFVGSKYLRGKGSPLPASNLFGLFTPEKIPRWRIGMQSVAKAKSKIGHAVVMMMQVGVLEKFKNIPMVTGLDLACFAGVVFVSSACIFVLSRLSAGGNVSTS